MASPLVKNNVFAIFVLGTSFQGECLVLDSVPFV